MSAESVRRWRRDTKRRIVECLGGKCCICGYDRYMGAFDLHHLDPATKEATIASMMVSPRSRREIGEEVAKCVLLCKNCHAEYHAGLVTIPAGAKRIIAEEFVVEWEKKLPVCEYCGKERSDESLRYCSMVCAGKANETEESKRMTEERLAEMVWEKTLDEIGKGLRVDGVTIKNWCKRLNVAIPPKGYWMRRRKGCSHEEALVSIPKPIPRNLRLSRELIEEIRRKLGEGRSVGMLAHEYGCCGYTIRNIKDFKGRFAA